MPLKLIRGLLQKKDYESIKDILAATAPEKLAALWPDLAPMEKLAGFKLLDQKKSLQLYDRLSFEDKYFLFCGFPKESIAPLLEDMTEGQKELFCSPSPRLYEAMLRGLDASIAAEPTLA